MRKALFIALLVWCAVTVSSAQTAPKLTLSATQVQTHSSLKVHGSGFTPKRNLSSHLLKPDGKEYPVISMLADDRGEFAHEIETLLLEIGTHELWVVDDSSKTSSNRVKFEVHR